MWIYLLRHGRTEYNAQKRYQGQRDIPLSPESAAQLRRADFSPKVVYVTPLQRTSQTAKILFPDAKLVPVEGLKEMNFGRFEGQKFVRVEQDPEYLEWVRQNEASAHPDGERKSDFYDAINDVTDAMKGMLAPKFREVSLGELQVRQVYKISNVGTVAGCRVTSGKITRDSKVRVVRDGIVITEDEIASLKRFKDDAKEVAEGYECGVTLAKFADVKEGDVYEAFKMEEYRD